MKQFSSVAMRSKSYNISKNKMKRKEGREEEEREGEQQANKRPEYIYI